MPAKVKKPLPVRPLSKAEKALVAKIDLSWSRERALSELKAHLQVAIEIELATIPVYLYAYYSILRTPSQADPSQSFPQTALSRYADMAGGMLMSVAVEEMLHMSLSSNILFALGTQPQLYLRSPSPFPTNLPAHNKLAADKLPLAIPLAPFSLKQLRHFILDIELPAQADAPPEGGNWDTIGQIYSYIRCIISSKHIHDGDFLAGDKLRQIQPERYSPNSIDTAYPSAPFDFQNPIAAPLPGSAAQVASFPSREDSHAGRFELITVVSKETALQAIQTIDAQGEGYGPTSFADESHKEYSHYYKFLIVQSYLKGYENELANLPVQPQPPAPASQPFGSYELSQITANFPENPVSANYPPGRRGVANLVSGLYQYMLIMTETIFRKDAQQQKLYFNVSLHRSMIWILDKIIRTMRAMPLDPANPGQMFAPTFENVDLGPRDQAFATLVNMANDLNTRYDNEDWYTADLQSYVNMIPTLPDVSAQWVPGVPKFPANPPTDFQLQPNEVRHACMGLNECAGQGRTRDNSCAGQGYCATALKFNFEDPSSPLVSDHHCHVLNQCAGQGGCGLYGTAQEQMNPGANDCANLGSCATPINAERFSTDGLNRGRSVWVRAREVFTEKSWPELCKQNPKLPKQPPQVPGSKKDPDMFKYGPTMEWIQDYSDQGMTACGASGMSGAHSCA